VSGPTDHFATDKGDEGWGCGYRNIQMMCSNLLHYEVYKKALFEGCGYVPTVPVLQEWIEIAWTKGFDSTGAKQLGGSMYNTTKMIGTTEAAALLRSFGIK
jgi:hypothetical protein